MRCFIAVPLPEATKDYIGSVIEPLRRKLSLIEGVRITWVGPEVMHITLAFMGEQDEVHLGKIRAGMAFACSGIKAFPIGFRGISTFPRRGTPRVITASISDGANNMERIEAGLRTSLSGLWYPDRAGFTPHITIGRVKLADRTMRKELDDTQINGTFTADRIILFESILHRNGPEYRGIETLFLKE